MPMPYAFLSSTSGKPADMTTLYLTGFGPFGEVKSNPTSEILEFLRCGGPLTSECVKERIDILDVSTTAIDEYFEDKHLASNNISIHLGVNSKATKFALESTAYNNMDFRIPDDNGYQPEKVQIVEANELDDPICTNFNLEDVCAAMKEDGYQCEISEDPGRYLCNFIYYKSLQRQETLGHSGYKRSVFIHVPPFDVIDKETQISFVRRVLEELSRPTATKGDRFPFDCGVFCGALNF